MSIQEIGIDDVPGLTTSEEAGFCMTPDARSYINEARQRNGLPPLTKDYDEWEEEVLPIFRQNGYEPVAGWFTIEGDSFGPLIRGITLEKEGQRYRFAYG